MNTIITVISIILFLVLSIIIYNGLNGMNQKKKIIIFFIEIIVCFVFTTILFNLSSIGIEYLNSKNKGIAMRTLVAIFTPINGIILLPNITRIINESQNGEINKDFITFFPLKLINVTIFSTVSLMFSNNDSRELDPSFI